jgi:cation diffusion facilitator family transporter
MTMREIKSMSSARSVTLAGIVVNGLLIVLKMLAGVYGHSQALVADAVHSVSDLFTDVVVLFGLRMGQKPPDGDHHFGHGRIETLASATIGLALLGTAVYLGAGAVVNIYRHTEYHPTFLAIAGAGVSIIFKELLYQYSVYVGKRLESQLLIANAWHHRSDALSSVAVLIGVTGARINPSWHILDAVATLVVSFFIIKVGTDILRNTLREISDAAPPPEVLQKIKTCSLSVDGVIDTHDLRVRSLAGQYQMEIHIVVDGGQTVAQGHDIAKSVESCISEEVRGVNKVIVHVDPLTKS